MPGFHPGSGGGFDLQDHWLAQLRCRRSGGGIADRAQDERGTLAEVLLVEKGGDQHIGDAALHGKSAAVDEVEVVVEVPDDLVIALRGRVDDHGHRHRRLICMVELMRPVLGGDEHDDLHLLIVGDGEGFVWIGDGGDAEDGEEIHLQIERLFISAFGGKAMEEERSLPIAADKQGLITPDFQ